MTRWRAARGMRARQRRAQPITFFEITTAAAFLAFARQPADVTLLETGLGGRFDATNVIARPARHRDHAGLARPSAFPRRHRGQDRLREGRHLQAARAGGAGAANRPRRKRCWWRAPRELGAPLFRFGQEWRAWPATAGLHYESRRWKLDLPPPGLLGRASIRQCRHRARLPRSRGASCSGPAALARRHARRSNGRRGCNV